MDPRSVSAALIHLLRLCAWRHDYRFWQDHFVYGDAWYDQQALAISFGLQKYNARHMLLVYAYLDMLFLAATLDLQSRGYATLEREGDCYVCVLNEKGRELADYNRPAWYPSKEEVEASDRAYDELTREE